jgi:hypothetical protein
MAIVIARTFSGQPVAFEVDGRPIESDAVNAAEVAIGGATGSAKAAASGAVTLNNATAGVITSETLSTAAAAIYTLTLTSNLILAGSVVFASVALGTSTTGDPIITQVAPAAGSVVIKVKNDHASAALNGTIKIGFAIYQ